MSKELPKGTFICPDSGRLKWIDTGKFARWDGKKPEKKVKQVTGTEIPEEVLLQVKNAKDVEEKIDIYTSYFLENPVTRMEAFKFFKDLLPYAKPKRQSTENINQNYDTLMICFENDDQTFELLENDFSKQLLKGEENDNN